MSCNQGRDCPARRIPPYPHTPGEELPECPCEDRPPSKILVILAWIVMILSVAMMTGAGLAVIAYVESRV